MLYLLWALIALIFFWVIPNVTVFGPAYLVARRLAPPNTARRTAFALGMAIVVAFSLRLPGIARDLSYFFGGDSVRYIKHQIKVPAGTRVGLDIQLVTHSKIPDHASEAADPIALFRPRYFPSVRPAGDMIGVVPIQPSYETPRRRLVQSELILNERTPESEALQIHLKGRETDTHFEIDVWVTEHGETVAAYRDQIRLRWPFSNPWVSFFTQMSILDTIADSAFPGTLADQRSGTGGPITTFLNEVIAVTPQSLPASTAAQVTFQPIELSMIRQPPSASSRWAPGNCVSPGIDTAYDVLSYQHDGVSRWRSHELTVGSDKTRGIAAVACTNLGVATIGPAIRDNRQVIVAFDRDLDVRCAFTFEIPDSTLSPAKYWSAEDLALTPRGFEVQFVGRQTGGERPVAAFVANIEPPLGCASQGLLLPAPSEEEPAISAVDSADTEPEGLDQAVIPFP